jgi:PDZ domain
MHLENLSSPGGANGGEKPKPELLDLVINKDKNGYGMKVSGENPVFVDSVKDGGAAQRAGLNAADMILRVNGHNVRFSTHAEVVQLMKATQIVSLTVQRNARNFPIPSGGLSSNLGTPTTPTSQRNSITAPLPVDVRVFSLMRLITASYYFSNVSLIALETKRGRIHQTPHTLHDVGAGEEKSGEIKGKRISEWRRNRQS